MRSREVLQWHEHVRPPGTGFQTGGAAPAARPCRLLRSVRASGWDGYPIGIELHAFRLSEQSPGDRGRRVHGDGAAGDDGALERNTGADGDSLADAPEHAASLAAVL